jgi:hypothetical protein
MKYNFSIVVLKNVKQQPMMAEEGGTAPWTALLALQSAIINDSQENIASKLTRYKLFQKLLAHTDALPALADAEPASSTDYTAEEVVLLKAAVLTYPTLFAGQLTDILDRA